MEAWHWNLESSRSVLARLSWIEQAATRSRATVSPWMSVAANGPETDCAGRAQLRMRATPARPPG
jgi:hypothetical protein